MKKNNICLSRATIMFLLKVCEYVRVKYGMNNSSNPWLVRSNASSGAIREVVQYGIIPR